METKEYEHRVLQTESKPTAIAFGTLGTHAILGLIAKTGAIVDQAKKATFYAGRTIDLPTFKAACEELAMLANHLAESAESGQLSNPGDVTLFDLPEHLAGLDLNNINKRLLHVVYGVSSEAGEQAEALAEAWETGKPVDRVNFAEEVGDVFWYLGVAADELRVPFSVLFDQNITKLQDKKDGRYRQGSFDVDSAINRNLTAERGVLERFGAEPKPAIPAPHLAGDMSIKQAEEVAKTVTQSNLRRDSVDQPENSVVGSLKGFAGKALDAADAGIDKAKAYLTK